MRPQIKSMTPWQTEFQKRTKERRTVYFSKLSQNTTSTPPKPQQPRRRNTYHIWIMLIGLYWDHRASETKVTKVLWQRRHCFTTLPIISASFQIHQWLLQRTAMRRISRTNDFTFPPISSLSHTQTHSHSHRCFFPKPILFSFCPHESIEQNFIPVAPLWRSKRNTRRRHRGPRPAQRNKLWTCAVSSSFLWQSCSS